MLPGAGWRHCDSACEAEVIPSGQFQDLLLSAQLGREGTQDEQTLLPRRWLEEEGWMGDARQSDASRLGSADSVSRSGKARAHAQPTDAL